MTTAFKHQNIINIAGVLGVAPELRLTANGTSVATLIAYTNYTPRNDDGSTARKASATVWGLHDQKAARLLRKGSKIRVQGRMTYPTWKDKTTGATRYGAEIVAQTLQSRASPTRLRPRRSAAAASRPGPPGRSAKSRSGQSRMPVCQALSAPPG